MNNDVIFSTGNNEYSTPQDLFDKLNELFNFTLDPCSTHENAKCKKHYTKEEDGLKQNWENETVFCNPPYSNPELGIWVRKCYEESKNGDITVVMLITSKTETKAWQKTIFPHARGIVFIDGRLKFNGMKAPAPFPSAIVIFQKDPLGFIQGLKLAELGHLDERKP